MLANGLCESLFNSCCSGGPYTIHSFFFIINDSRWPSLRAKLPSSDTSVSSCDDSVSSVLVTGGLEVLLVAGALVVGFLVVTDEVLGSIF